VLECAGAPGWRIDLDRSDQAALGDRAVEEVGRRQVAPSLKTTLVEKTEDSLPIEDDS
jgi:hypothetical protein